MKKLLTSLLLTFIVSAMLFSTVKIQPVFAATEQIVNGGFEDELTGWDGWFFVIDHNNPHSGSHSASQEHGSQMYQTFSSSIPVSWIQSLTFWYRLPANGYLSVIIKDNDGTVIYAKGATGFHDWTEYIVDINELTGDNVKLINFFYQITDLPMDARGNVDDVSLITDAPTEYLVRFRAEPSGLFSVHFYAGGWYWSPQDLNLEEGDRTFTIESGSLIRIVNDTWIYGFDHWSITNTTGTFNSTGSSVDYNLQEDTNVTMAYSYVTISVNASPSEVLSHVFFSDEYYGTNFTAPETLHMNSGYHTLTATTYQYYPNSSYVYTFDYWLVNGTTNVGSLAINESFTADTTLEMVYAGSTVIPPFTHIYAAAALNATWYFRSDTHTVATVLGYRLLTTNTQTPASYSNSIAGSQETSYGVRVWAVGFFNETYELTAGSPEVICTKATNGSEMMIGYWNCPAFNVMTNAIKVQVYQRFGSDSWSLTRIFITSANLLYRFPASTWTFHFYVSRIETTITNSTFWHGSYTTYNSRVDLEYYKANPWDVAMARLNQRNIFGFMFTPWTYWFGDVFWSILLFGCIVMGILRTGSLKLVLATLWILGGSGSILWALIPASALHIAVVMLALAMAITFFRLIRGK